jgi:hypothetical protein
MDMTATAFLAGVGLMAFLVILSARRYLGSSVGWIVIAGLGSWLIYVGILSYLGIVSNVSSSPPGVFYIVAPVFVLIVLFAVRSKWGVDVALALPIGLLIGAQVFRVGVELGFHKLWEHGLVPKMMTYEGGNIDILIGLSAPIAAWLISKNLIGRKLAIAWNIVGLFALANIVARSALTSPGPLNFIHAEVPNLAIGTFPYTYIAGFFAPLALLLHVLCIRHLCSLGSAKQSSAQI